MIKQIRKLLDVEEIRNINWYKNGERVQLQLMRVFGDNESATVRISNYYHTFIFSLMITKRVYMSRAFRCDAGKDSEKCRVISSETQATLGIGRFQPLLTVHFLRISRNMESGRAVKEIQTLVEENTDPSFPTCHSQQWMVGCRLGKK